MKGKVCMMGVGGGLVRARKWGGACLPWLPAAVLLTSGAAKAVDAGALTRYQEDAAFVPSSTALPFALTLAVTELVLAWAFLICTTGIISYAALTMTGARQTALREAIRCLVRPVNETRNHK